MRAVDQAGILRILRKELPYLHEQYGVEQIALFGSYASQGSNADSDVDLMVSLSEPLGFRFIDLAVYLESKLRCKVDLITDSTLERGTKEIRRAHIARDIQKSLIYV